MADLILSNETTNASLNCHSCPIPFVACFAQTLPAAHSCCIVTIVTAALTHGNKTVGLIASLDGTLAASPVLYCVF